LAVKYGHAEAGFPLVTPEVNALAKVLLDATHIADMQATKEEKQRVLDVNDLPSLVLDAFLRALPTFIFSAFNLPKNAKSVAWKKGGRLYIIEQQMRKQVMAQLDPDIAAALGATRRKPTELAAFTIELLRAFEDMGWLVTKIGEAEVLGSAALWDIKAGTIEFKGIIIIDPPADVLDLAPKQDSPYAVSVLYPHFKVPGEITVTANDLLDSGLLRDPAKKSKDKPKRQVVPQISKDLPEIPGAQVAARPASVASSETPQGEALEGAYSQGPVGASTTSAAQPEQLTDFGTPPLEPQAMAAAGPSAGDEPIPEDLLRSTSSGENGAPGRPRRPKSVPSTTPVVPTAPSSVKAPPPVMGNSGGPSRRRRPG
jgi:hypothetical protein